MEIDVILAMIYRNFPRMQNCYVLTVQDLYHCILNDTVYSPAEI